MWYNQKVIKRILDELSIEYKLPSYVIREIIESQFFVVKEVVSNKRFETIRLPKFGKFLIKFTTLNKYYDLNNEREDITEEEKARLMEGLLFKYEQYLKDKTIKRRLPEEKITKDLLIKYNNKKNGNKQ